MKLSQKFEQQIQMIHMLVEQDGSDVEWNDNIPDPDNPNQPRQIDVTIRRNRKLTIVECRIHKKKQDVKWIEELIGRRISLKADALIAVSASGFTKGAILKAEKYGVILRDFLSLTKDEIAAWGKQTKTWLTYYEYSKISLTFVFSKIISPNIGVTAIGQYYLKNPDNIYGIFEAVAKGIDDKLTSKKQNLFATVFPDNMHIDGFKPKEVRFNAQVRTRKKTLEIPSVVVYDQPNVNALERNVLVEQVDFGNFEIAQSNNKVMVSLDLTPVPRLPNSQFRFVNFDFQRPVSVTGFRILGTPKLEIPINKIKLLVVFE